MVAVVGDVTARLAAADAETPDRALLLLLDVLYDVERNPDPGSVHLLVRSLGRLSQRGGDHAVKSALRDGGSPVSPTNEKTAAGQTAAAGDQQNHGTSGSKFTPTRILKQRGAA